MFICTKSAEKYQYEKILKTVSENSIKGFQMEEFPKKISDGFGALILDDVTFCDVVKKSFLNCFILSFYFLQILLADSMLQSEVMTIITFIANFSNLTGNVRKSLQVLSRNYPLLQMTPR